MGILTTSVKYGGLFLAAREGVKAYERHNEKKNAQQQPQQPMPGQTSQYPQAQYQYPQQQPQYAEYSREAYPQQQLEYQQQPREAGFHQVWCNGRCGGKCGAKEALMALGAKGYSAEQAQEQVIDAKPPPDY
jgi:hypothetical protein